MQEEVLIALLSKLVDEKLKDFYQPSHGPRGFRGPKGEDGKDFNIADHEETIRSWVKEFSLKFSDLTDEEIGALRGPAGKDGKDGKDGTSFVFEESKDLIYGIIKSEVKGMSEELKLRFSDLSADDIEQLRGPRGREGRDGRDFNFEEHREFFQSLKLKFSDLSEEERESLVLKFSSLTPEEKEGLKLRFEDLTDSDKALLRGPRGVRGQRGRPGLDGRDGLDGKSIRGLPGPIGIAGARGRDGNDGEDGEDGKDAPYVVDIAVKETSGYITFIFIFSDGTEIVTNEVKLPSIEKSYITGSGGGGSNNVIADSLWDSVSASVAASTSGVLYSLPLATFSGGTFHIRLASTSNAYRRSLKMDVVNNDGQVEDQVYAIMGHLFNLGLSAGINGSNVELVLTNNELFDVSANILLEAN